MSLFNHDRPADDGDANMRTQVVPKLTSATFGQWDGSGSWLTTISSDCRIGSDGVANDVEMGMARQNRPVIEEEGGDR